VINPETFQRMEEGYSVSIILEDYTSKNSGIHSYDPQTFSKNIGIDLKVFFDKYNLINLNLDNFRIYITKPKIYFNKIDLMEYFLENIIKTVINDINEYGDSKTFPIPKWEWETISTTGVENWFDLKNIFNEYYSKIININYEIDEIVSILADRLFGSYIGYDLNNISTIYTFDFGNAFVEFTKVGDYNGSRIQCNNRKHSIEIISKNIKKFYMIVLLECKDELICNFYENDGSKLNTKIKDLTEEQLPNINCIKLHQFIDDICFYKKIHNVIKLKDCSKLICTEFKERREGTRDKKLIIQNNSEFNNWENSFYSISNDVNERIFQKMEDNTNKNYSDYCNDSNKEISSLPPLHIQHNNNMGNPYLGRATSVALHNHNF
jgi:hypothetical protein